MLIDASPVLQAASLTPYQALGIPIALVGAVFLSLGAQLQSQGVAKVEARGTKSTSGLSLKQLGSLLSRPSWVAGTVMLGLAIVLQLTSLRIAPLIVVQPLGAVALVVTAVLNSRATGQRLDLKAKRAIGLCIGGVGLFVIFAAVFAQETPIRTPELITILVILTVVLALLGGLFLYFRKHVRAIFYIISAGVLYGFVATLAKVIINRITIGEFDVLTAVCVVALIAATLLGAYFVQTAYSSGPPDLVIAGLTVVDPLVAVFIGVTVLGEAAGAPLYAVVAFVVAGAIAVSGVFQLAKHHPHVS